jgi:hypothetical protein
MLFPEVNVQIKPGVHQIIIIIIQFFIISVLHQQPEGQLQMQHKGRQNNKYNKITTIRL